MAAFLLASSCALWEDITKDWTGGEASFIPTPMEVVDRMLEIAQVTSVDIIYDLGSGDGRIVIRAAENRRKTILAGQFSSYSRYPEFGVHLFIHHQDLTRTLSGYLIHKGTHILGHWTLPFSRSSSESFSQRTFLS